MSARQPLHPADLDEVDEAIDNLVSEAKAQGWRNACSRHPEHEIADELDRRRSDLRRAILSVVAASALLGCGGGGDSYTPVMAKCETSALSKPGGSESSCPVITNN